MGSGTRGLSIWPDLSLGLLFVKAVDFTGTNGLPKNVLHALQNDLIDKYDPLCCNDRSPTNRRLRAEWEAVHGLVEEVSRRSVTYKSLADSAHRELTRPLAPMSDVIHDGDAPGKKTIRTGEKSSPLATDLIRILIDYNPKLVDSKSRLRFDCYKNGMTVAQHKNFILKRLGVVEARKQTSDLQFDSARGYISIERNGKRLNIPVPESLQC